MSEEKTLIDDIYEMLMREYEYRQMQREEKLKNKKIISATEIANFCEEKAILRLRGVKPEIKKERIGARLHGVILHETFERLLNLYFRGKYDMEKEVVVKMKDWKIIGHPDIMLINRNMRDLYDFKFVNPTKFKIAQETKEPSLLYIWQTNLYMYMLRKNGIPIEKGHIVYVNKSSMTFRSKGEKKRIDEFSLLRLDAPYNEKAVAVLLKHAEDIITKFERGEDGFNVEKTVEKLKSYYEMMGLDPSVIDKENFPKWGCEYCDYIDICPVRKMEKKINNQKEMEL